MTRTEIVLLLGASLLIGFTAGSYLTVSRRPAGVPPATAAGSGGSPDRPSPTGSHVPPGAPALRDSGSAAGLQLRPDPTPEEVRRVR